MGQIFQVPAKIKVRQNLWLNTNVLKSCTKNQISQFLIKFQF